MKLNKLDKTVIILFHYQELPVREIAMIIKKTESATLQCLRRARMVATLAIFLLSGTTVLAGAYVINRTSINGDVLPELDTMSIVELTYYEEGMDEDGYVNKNYSSYDAIQSELNIELLDTTLFEENEYVQGNVYTDNKDFMIIKLENYILGDTENYVYDSAEGFYRYYNAISLEINIILSEKCAVFVADGIQYTLKGRVSKDTMKEIVDSMMY